MESQETERDKFMEGDKMKKGLVCVTGGTGFFASWLIKRLLEDGYSVNTTIRSSSDRTKNINYLTDLPGASERLRIFNADLDKPDSFAAAMEGCIGVFHVAHPMDFEGKETEEMKINRAVSGTIGILQTCLNSKTVKRVVYTSSASTVASNDKGLNIMDERCWSDVDFIRRTLGDSGLASYAITKTLTEKAALDFAEKHGLDLALQMNTPISTVGERLLCILMMWPGHMFFYLSILMPKGGTFVLQLKLLLISWPNVCQLGTLNIKC